MAMEMEIMKRPRRRCVVLDQRYWANVDSTTSDPTETFSGSVSSDDDEYKDSSGDDEASDVELNEEIMNNYIQNRTGEEANADLILKKQQQLVRGHMEKIIQSRSRTVLNYNREYEIERYFVAPLRQKYRKTDTKVAQLKKTLTPGKTGSERGSKPRKGNRTGKTPNEKLPIKPNEEISVSKEIRNLDPELNLSTFRSNQDEEEVEQRLKQIQQDFPAWMFLLKEGFNIMLHGYGSKEQIFQDFKCFLDEKYLVIYINGLFPTKLNARKFLVDFCNTLHQNIKVTGNNLQLIAEEIKTKLENKRGPRIFFLVKNCEMLAVKNKSIFKIICILAQVKFIHLITSCDHVNSFVDIDQTNLISLNFWWILCPTFVPYQTELLNLTGVFGQDIDANNTKTSIQHIFKSLTSNAKKAFTELATLQLEALLYQSKNNNNHHNNKKKSGKQLFEGIQFRELFRKCQQNFIAHSHQTLTTLLVEFIDHKLISFTGKRASMEFLMINLDETILDEFLKNQKLGI